MKWTDEERDRGSKYNQAKENEKEEKGKLNHTYHSNLIMLNHT